jgi:glucose/arabinose dehydrogenase
MYSRWWMNKRLVIIIILIAVVGLGYYLFTKGRIPVRMNGKPTSTITISKIPDPKDPNAPAVAVVAENLDTPWGIAFLPNNDMLVTERPGNVRLISGGNVSTVATIPNVREISEGGLLGIALHPQFETNKYVYLYYTYGANGGNTLNRVVRMRFDNNQLVDEEVIVDDIPGAPNHNGGRIKFGPDNNLYIATGDAHEPSLAQDKNSLAGKILRVTDTGQAAPGNPFGNRTYSYGHRNPQGIAWDNNGVLWETEHGPSGVWPDCCQDEVNKIESGKNYGWPDSVGDNVHAGTVAPIIHSGRDRYAPGSAAVTSDTVYFGGLRGAALYTYPVVGGSVAEHFKDEFGRIREAVVGPDGMLYITTSNNDGRGSPSANDDKIIRVNPAKL